jgi:hypothetical protein
MYLKVKELNVTSLKQDFKNLLTESFETHDMLTNTHKTHSEDQLAAWGCLKDVKNEGG